MGIEYHTMHLLEVSLLPCALHRSCSDIRESMIAKRPVLIHYRNAVMIVFSKGLDGAMYNSTAWAFVVPVDNEYQGRIVRPYPITACL